MAGKLPDLERVAALIREVSDAEALPRWRNLADGDIVEKDGPNDVVTIADRAVEEALTRRLPDLLPGSVVVGEEAVHADPARLAWLRGDDPVWIIDPIDGTAHYAAGSPDFAVMVGLIVDRQVAAGWILVPVTGELTAAVRGEGAWRTTADGATRRLPPVHRTGRLADMSGVVGRKQSDPDREARVAAAKTQFRSVERAICAGLDYPRLCAGDLDFSLYNKSEPWDHLPGLAMVAELGFHYARHDGTPYRPGDNVGGLIVAPDAASWNQIKSLLVG
jgi:fructose-1,6-bisphosphatase/inositol monophosphatase family enzyme